MWKANPVFKEVRRLSFQGFILVAGFAAMQASAAEPQASAAAPTIDKAATEALKSMGAHMRELKIFTVHADTTIDEVTDDGQKLQFGGTVDFRVRRPDRLRADVDSDRRHRSYFYDGKTLTQYSPRMGYYASVSAPPTIGELLDVLKNRYDIPLPLTDLFLWGTDKNDGGAITAASFVGPSKIGGIDCDHYAFRQSDVDWQVWIGHDKELPCKLVITTTEEASQPQYVAQFTWHTGINLDDKTFVFDKSKSSHKIEMAVVDASDH